MCLIWKYIRFLNSQKNSINRNWQICEMNILEFNFCENLMELKWNEVVLRHTLEWKYFLYRLQYHLQIQIVGEFLQEFHVRHSLIKNMRCFHINVYKSTVLKFPNLGIKFNMDFEIYFVPIRWNVLTCRRWMKFDTTNWQQFPSFKILQSV